jgi:hypothetical protein
VRKVNTSNIINTVAGNGVSGCAGEGIPATQAQITVVGLAADGQGNLFLAGCSRVRKVNSAGVITTVAGTGIAGFSGDGGPATNAQLNNPTDVTFDGQGNLYIADRGNNRIRKVASNGIITTIAGTGIAGFAGDWGPATDAQFSAVESVVYYNGGLYLGDSQRVRRIDSSGTIGTIAGPGINPGPFDLFEMNNGFPAKLANFRVAYKLGIDGSGNLYVDQFSHIRKIEPVSAGSATLTLTTP